MAISFRAVLVPENPLAQLPALLSPRGIELKQRKGYKAGKLSKGGNWCQINDGDIALRVNFPNRKGVPKTWLLFARFPENQPPEAPWDRPWLYERKLAQWMPAGSDVWGIALEDVAKPRIIALQTIAKDLEESFRLAS